MKRHPYYTQRRLTSILRAMNEACVHPIAGCSQFMLDARGVLTSDVEDSHEPWLHVEYIPGDGLPFDAVAAARRLLAAWRDHQASGQTP